MSGYRIVNHRIPSAHIREFARATAHTEEDQLQLEVKQYIPLDNPRPQPGDVTILAAHANGFPKELYEALWEELLARSRSHGWRIRSIWMADVAWQGASAVLNEALLGNDPCWNDHARDLAHLVNLKRDEMPRPIVGIGHSMGGAQLVRLALFHPSLFTTLFLLDPVVQRFTDEFSEGSKRRPRAALSTNRRTKWASREEARKGFLRSPFYQAWDRRCVDAWVTHGLRDCPNHQFPEASAPEVSLTTPVGQEVWTFLRPNYEGHGVGGGPVDRVTHPDIDRTHPFLSPFYRAEPALIYSHLPELRPSCCYIFGSTSSVSVPELSAAKVANTGIGPGGSGGAAEGRVKGVTLEGIGHMIPMEAPGQTAELAVEWIGAEMERHRERQDYWEKHWWAKPLREKQEIDERWRAALGVSVREKKPTESKI